ncbi:MAG: MBL fold metallo-hydrolase [Patescibacteria group bacterium]
MKLTILGTGTSTPTKKRNSSGYFLKIKKKSVLLDCGSGITKQMMLAGKKYWDIDYIFITHLHADHIADLGYLLHGIYIRSDHRGHKRNKKLEIYGPPGFAKSYQYQRKAISFPAGKESYEVKIYEIKNKKLNFSSFCIESREVKHAPNLTCLGYRFKERGGKTLVYGGDTGFCKGIVKLAKNADALILPVSLPEHIKTSYHLIPSEVGQVTQGAKAKKLYLTHFYPITEKYDVKKIIKKYYKGPTTIAKDLMEIRI